MVWGTLEKNTAGARPKAYAKAACKWVDTGIRKAKAEIRKDCGRHSPPTLASSVPAVRTFHGPEPQCSHLQNWGSNTHLTR